jgi:hypothetical protein
MAALGRCGLSAASSVKKYARFFFDRGIRAARFGRGRGGKFHAR